MFAGAIVVGSALGLAAQANADPNAFGGLSCSCRETAPPGSPVLTEKIKQGLHDGLAEPPAASGVVQ
jgi:hypothetical protein